MELVKKEEKNSRYYDDVSQVSSRNPEIGNIQHKLVDIAMARETAELLEIPGEWLNHSISAQKAYDLLLVNSIKCWELILFDPRMDHHRAQHIY